MNVTPFEIVNWGEVVLWPAIGVVCLIRAIQLHPKSSNWLWILAPTFLLFGVSDFIELRTGAWWKPVWLLLLKVSCIGVFVAAGVSHYRSQLRREALIKEAQVETTWMDLADYKRQYGDIDDAAPGWDAIDTRLQAVYGEQEPKHWGTVIKHMLGGPDPIDGISAYECRDGGIPHLHFCTYGYTSLYYDEEAVGGEFSQFGFEMTFRLASELPPSEEPIWVCSLLQNVARYVFNSGKWFEPYHWIPANGPIRADFDTYIVGLAFLNDPALEPVASPHGRVEFIQAFGITQTELDAFQSPKDNAQRLVESHRETNPLLVTDLARSTKD